jgi:hypothetical protein
VSLCVSVRKAAMYTRSVRFEEPTTSTEPTVGPGKYDVKPINKRVGKIAAIRRCQPSIVTNVLLIL